MGGYQEYARSISTRSWIAIALTAVALVAPTSASAAASCPISYGATDDAKPNKLYLYYPTAADPTFPEFGGAGFETSPLDPFDISLLTSYTGTVDQLRNAVTDVVIDDYCEFNVQVLPTLTAPPATFARREIVGIGTDDNVTGRWGRSNLTDVGDPTPVGYGRVWAGRYQNDGSGSPGGALEGSNSTLERWANAIGGTAAHEGGHSYGLVHHSDVLPGEDALGRHIMPAGSDVNSEQRAGYRRHFSDTEFATLASNVGLSIQTMHNWDLVNPNSTTAHQFRLTFLSTQPSMLMSWDYEGTRSPWIDPVVSGPVGTQMFKGTTYNRFQMVWSLPHGWIGGPGGEVPAGAEFHVGATFSGVDFNQPDPIIITKSELLDDSGDPLPLKPRLPGYDAGEVDVDDGSFAIDFTNTGTDSMRIENVVVRELPRVMSIDSMVRRAPIMDPFGEPFNPWPNGTRTVLQRSRPLDRKRGSVEVEVAQLRERRQILDAHSRNCDAGDAPAGLSDSPSCIPGFDASLFPATTMFLTADAVTPNTKVWSPRKKRFVKKPLKSRVYYQFGGRTIDLNRNGVDDAIDIEFGKSADANGDGVPDEAQGR
jgi:hypothetical protein